MSESYSKIFFWQLVIAAVVGIMWAVFWEMTPSETGFFYDLPVGLFQGFVVGLVVIVVIGLLVEVIWALIGMGAAGGFGAAMTQNMDKMATASLVESTNSRLDSMNSSGIGMAIEWAVKVLVVFGIAGGIVWSLDPNLGIGLVVTLLVGLGGGFAIVWWLGVTDTLASNLSGGFDWLPLSGLAEQWESWGLVRFWGFAGAAAFGIGWAFAAGGLGAGIVQAIVLALVALVASLAGGFIGVQMKKSG